MKVFILSILFLVLSISVTTAQNEKLKPILKPIDIAEVCKDTTSVTVCESTLKSLGADKAQQKHSRFAQTLIRHAQNEFGHTAIVAREKMREDDLDMKIKKALSHCVKMYLDIADQLRGLFLAASSREFASEGGDFSHMARNFPRHCEHELTKVGTSGEKLALYKNYKDLEDLASTVDAVYSHVYTKKAEKAAESPTN